MKRARALVTGGTGVIGGAVLRALARERARIATTFTFHANEGKATALAAELSMRAARVDFTEPGAAAALVASLDDPPDVLVHCACAPATATLAIASRVTGEAALDLTTALVARAAGPGRATGPVHAVFVGALAGAQSLPIPPAFAAAQGMLGPLAMSLAKKHGAALRANLVVAGPTGAGISASLDPSLVRDYEKFSALRRLATPAEIAAPIVFLVLDSDYMTGKTLVVNGGL